MLSIKKNNFEVSTDLRIKCDSALQRFLARKDIGFSQLPDREALWASCEKVGQSLRPRFTDMVIVGIGGSALGPRVLAELFQAPRSSHRLHFCDNVDPYEFRRLIDAQADLEKTCWAIVSKSGSTIETLTATDFIREFYQSRGLTFYDQVVVITEPRSNPLRDWAQRNKIECLEIPLDVGGRFSVLSPVGALPAAFLNVPLGELRQGASAALRAKNEIIEMMAQAMLSFQRQEWISFFWFYSSGLKNFGGWLQQLWAESLGKKFDRKGRPAPRVSSPFSAVGACDQHSVLQQVMEGARDKFVVFTRVQSLEDGLEPLRSSEFEIQKFLAGKKMGDLLSAEADATQRALVQESVSTLALVIKDQSPAAIGYLFMFWQLVVAGLGEFLDINAFDQPGVELGKKLAKESLKG